MNNLSILKFGSICIFAILLHFTAFSNTNGIAPRSNAYSSKLLIERFNELELEVDVRLTKKVKKHIKAYTYLARRSSERLLGKSTLYFPIFEKINKSFGLPSELKYLMIIESALKPTIVSPSGARGLWQLMPGTARMHGLQINDYVDERCDPYRSTRAM